MTGWTTREDLRGFLQRRWDRGDLLRSLAGEGIPFPWRIPLKTPRGVDLVERFDPVRAWVRDLREGRGYRLETKTLSHPLHGREEVPSAAWFDAPEDALGVLRRIREGQRFREILGLTDRLVPSLGEWVRRNPLKALEQEASWPGLLEVVRWMEAHPRSGRTLRQVDAPGVHTKFLEGHRGILSELLDRALPPEAVDPSAPSGAKGFEERYGLRRKALRVRFRCLDPSVAPCPFPLGEDLEAPAGAFGDLRPHLGRPPLRRVFVTENETNFLAFPRMEGSWVLFGSGYGFEALREIPWLASLTLHYWGDLDTHGFGALDQFRTLFPRTRSFLMDRRTLLAHRDHWVREEHPLRRDLPGLTPEEKALYEDLRQGRPEERLRLEQERIPLSWVQGALEALDPLP